MGSTQYIPYMYVKYMQNTVPVWQLNVQAIIGYPIKKYPADLPIKKEQHIYYF